MYILINAGNNLNNSTGYDGPADYDGPAVTLRSVFIMLLVQQVNVTAAHPKRSSPTVQSTNPE